jgi:hypothetical protein
MVYHANDTGSINLRQPQTPKTPTAAAAFYFDDMLQRTKTSMVKRLRRSSTARSIGGPWGGGPPRPHVPFTLGSAGPWGGASDEEGGGLGEEEEDDEDCEERARRASMMRRKSSVGGWSKDVRRAMAAVDEKVVAYGAGRLEAVGRGEVAGAEDEIATVGGEGATSYFEVQEKKTPWSWAAS